MKFQRKGVNLKSFFLEILRRAWIIGRKDIGNLGGTCSFILFYDSTNFSQKLAFVNIQVTFNTKPMTRGLIQYLNCSGQLFKS